ncbi:hypothetical protein ACHAXT_012849 [Thalassiosira profunda]
MAKLLLLPLVAALLLPSCLGFAIPAPAVTRSSNLRGTTRLDAGFKLPEINLPWDTSSPKSSPADAKAPIQPNDRVVVFGGTGGVGQLVAKKLRARNKGYDVRVVVRDAARAQELLEDDAEGEVGVAELNLVGDDKAGDDELKMALEGATGVVVSLGTTAFPTKRWAGGNNPQAIDEEAVSRIANLAAETPTLRRMVLLTSVGVDRTGEMPFLILNLFGVLDAKKAGEEAVKNASARAGFGYAIVRPGRLVGGPYTNLDLANLFKTEGGASNGVTLERGDSLLGDCKRDATAEAVLQCLENVECEDVAFSMVSNEERALTDGEWGAAFAGMRD